MAQKVTWNKSKTNQMTGRSKVYTDKDGSPLPDGKYRWQRDLKEVEYEYPQISPLQCTSVHDVAEAIEEIISVGKSDFSTLTKFLAHVNHGLYRHPAIQLNAGKDTTLTPQQATAVKAFKSLVKIAQDMGQPELVQAYVEQLVMIGVPDAEFRLLGDQADAEAEHDAQTVGVSGK